MRLLEIKHVKPGMVLARPIYNLSDGKVLLYDNVELKKEYIDRLKERKFTYVYIKDDDDSSTGYELLEPVKHETKVKAVLALKKIMSTYYHTKQVDLHNLQEIVTEMLNEIFNNHDVFCNLADLRNYDDYTFAHSVNVCVLALIMGKVLLLNRNELEILGIGAILHDVGKIFIEEAVLNKPGNLDPSEFEKIKTHTIKGYEFLKGKISISYISAHIAYQHHERIDGSGYPRGLAEPQIHRFAKIVAVADVYDAMTAQRVYRKALPPYLVMKELRAEANIKFDYLVVEALSKVVAPFYIGSTLQLANDEKVVVTQVFPTKCWVKVLEGERQGTIFDLYRYPELMANIIKND
jgi:HD-GYP domain-containing protein (c-di-GMP phosphodiesterase class II)